MRLALMILAADMLLFVIRNPLKTLLSFVFDSVLAPIVDILIKVIDRVLEVVYRQLEVVQHRIDMRAVVGSILLFALGVAIYVANFYLVRLALETVLPMEMTPIPLDILGLSLAVRPIDFSAAIIVFIELINGMAILEATGHSHFFDLHARLSTYSARTRRSILLGLVVFLLLLIIVEAGLAAYRTYYVQEQHRLAQQLLLEGGQVPHVEPPSNLEKMPYIMVAILATIVPLMAAISSWSFYPLLMAATILLLYAIYLPLRLLERLLSIVRDFLFNTDNVLGHIIDLLTYPALVLVSVFRGLLVRVGLLKLPGGGEGV